ncbi:MAG TPA: sulfite exporter TauE/SafE family protein [Stellaceae bacterium]|nr:sulfite exporter TauE/SafE family protein [Stellaceae bacterium]
MRYPRRRALTLIVFLLLGGGAGIIVGVAIGATGIGGVLLVPLLAYILGVPVPMAIAVALWSYLWSGLVAVWLYARRGSVPWRPALWLCLAAAPAAYLGALAVAVAPSRVLEGLIAAILVLAGLNALRQPHVSTGATHPLGTPALAALGGMTGFAAALTGAGGALILVPLLVALGEPVLAAIGLGQVIQLPIAAIATLTNLWHGRIDLLLGSVLALALSLGIAAGVPLAHKLPQAALRRLLALTMLAAGAAIGVRLLLSAA